MSVRMVSLDTCAISPTRLDPPLHRVFHYQPPSLRRQRRLRKHTDRWWQAASEREGLEKVFLGEIDFPLGPREAVYGEIERFWDCFYKKYGWHDYFWWLELTAKGMPHYHFVLCNQPWELEREWRAFYKEVFGPGRHQPEPRKRTRDWFVRNGGAYAKKYVNKMAGPHVAKAYQQLYDGLPRELRTFSSAQMGFTVATLDEHRDQYDGAAVNIWDEIKVGLIDWYCTRILKHWRSKDGCFWQLRKRRYYRPHAAVLSARGP